MYCPSCGSEERQLSQFCRACGTDLRIVRNSLENPDAVTQSAISAREQIGMAVADKIRQMSSAKDLERVAEDVLPHFEKFLESPEEKRLRRIRSGIVTAAIGLGVIVNGLMFTLPRKSLPGDAYDALSQQVLDSNPNVNRLPYEAPAPANLPAGANLTNELVPAPRSQSSITEHTTHHLKTSKS
jgi:hypothetical protein